MTKIASKGSCLKHDVYFYQSNSFLFLLNCGQVVAPKKQKLREAQQSLSTTMATLDAKRAELKEVSEIFQQL